MKALETGLQTCKEFNEESTMTSFVDLILTLISEHATLCTRFPLLEYELQILPFFDLNLFWLRPDTIGTGMC